jgi:hypothetical protein
MEFHMIWDSPKHSSSPDLSSASGALIGEYRDKVLHEQAEAQQRRHRDLLEQTSIQHPAEIRIRIWEQLHQMDLPRDPAHSLIAVIASQTDLSVEQIGNEQRRRAQVRAVATASKL